MSPFWRSEHCERLPNSPLRDRPLTASVLSRAVASGGGFLVDEAIGSYRAASKLLLDEWQAEPLAPFALKIWMQASSRLAELLAIKHARRCR